MHCCGMTARAVTLATSLPSIRFRAQRVALILGARSQRQSVPFDFLSTVSRGFRPSDRLVRQLESLGYTVTLEAKEPAA